MKRCIPVIAFTFLAFFAAYAQEPVYAVKNVNVITMTAANQVIKNTTVVIEKRKISAISKTIPPNAHIIDGKGKWLIPGLIDMHVHNVADVNFGASYPTQAATFFINTQDFMLPYVASGVTSTFELSARPEHISQRNEIAKGTVIGPRIALAYLLNGGDGPAAANTPADGRQAVRMAKAEGYEFIKVYSQLNIETYKAIIDEARMLGMKVVGHIPNAFKGKTQDAFVSGFDMVAHAEEFSKQADSFTDDQARKFAAMAKANGTWLSPTLVTIEKIAAQIRSLNAVRDLPELKYVHPLIQSKWLTSNNYYSGGADTVRLTYFEKMIDFHYRLVNAFKEAGVPIVAGTDAGTSGVIWGYSLHDELALLVKCGLTAQEALASATRLPATWLGIEDKIGTIEIGKYADLVLLDANPLEQISSTKKIAGVFIDGRWVSKVKIDGMLSDLERRNNADKNKFDWKKRKELGR